MKKRVGPPRKSKRAPSLSPLLTTASAPAAPGELPTVKLRPQEDRRLRRGHLWVFSNEIAEAPVGTTPGALARFVTARDEYLGLGFYNPQSLIAGRLLDRRDRALPADFFPQRLAAARALREALFTDNAYRWVFGESDDLPGLVIDRFGDALVVESFAAGMDVLLPELLAALRAAGPWAAIVLKNDNAARRLERLPEEVRVLDGAPGTPHWFSSDGIALAADLTQGQKTGYFFDQRDNRRAVAALAAGKNVLDVFCHTGGFSHYCARAGARRVVGVDASAAAVSLARVIAEKNGWADRAVFEEEDAFAHLGRVKDTFEIVVLDPPRFAPSKKNVPAAVEAYIRLNALGLKRVAGGGFLATASCSQHIDRDTFRQIIARAAHVAGRKVKIIHQGGAGPDHPVRPTMPETDYLKFALLHVA
jgi:23S rRNA (cytosine1962-C5)-methyltransferase